ncbi:MFS transporter [Cetobacterium somerae]|uniref:MFS transporter n=1 Tax=Cetobacterium sp. NK01 TaxID=2993530 RepID=UPI002116B420|nr:MFS transporter [Cetobacterium sp. NK01]MCQ8212085.1 MFS transporter [Cetobacterium sp. NK01]
MENIKHMSELSLPKRLLAYLVILVGYFFYCYNFVVIDYVRPFLVQYYGITLGQTALFYTAQSIGALIGALSCAWFAENFGRKKVLILITLLNGGATLVNLSSRSFETWMIMRFIIGISLGGYFTVAVTVMVGLFTAKVRAKVTAFASSLFSIALIIMGAYGALLGESNWEMLMVIGGLPPVIAAIAMIFLVPSEKKYIPFGSEKEGDNETKAEEEKKGSWKEMFSGKLAKISITCILLSGLNFIGYQFFSGFVTVYLREVRNFDAKTMGILFSAASSGSLVGAYVWGFVADKFGRKVNAFGFILSSIMIGLYFVAPSNVTILSICGFVYGIGLASSAIWGGYFTELFPRHLKTMGASLFHGGRIIALFAPSIVVAVRNATSLQTAMWGAPILFTIAAILWLTLPETLETGVLYKKEN